MNALAEKLYQTRTFKGIVNMIGYGYIDPINRRVQSILNKSYQHILCADASQAIMNMWGKQQG